MTAAAHSDLAFEHAVRGDVAETLATAELAALSNRRALSMLDELVPAQRALVLDPGPEIAALVPRRGGKSFAAVMAALITGEAKPGSVTLIITLTLKSAKKIYWTNPRSSVKALARRFGLTAENGFYTNDQDLSWRHPNGSVGYLLGAENKDALEYIRGLEADLYIIDECKSFAASVLNELIDDILSPQRVSRLGRILMIGTPGNVLGGPFYRATNPAVVEEAEDNALHGFPYCVRYGGADPAAHIRQPGDAWSFHTWTLEDNTKMAHQWAEALRIKRKKGWADDHPTWLREYKAQWLPNQEGLVYRYLQFRGGPDRVTWVPERTKDNPTGLPATLGPWRIVFGMDLGYHDATALVIVAYSQTRGVLRHVWDRKKTGMDVIEAMEMVQAAVDRFGPPDMMFIDTGGGASKMVAETLRKRYGFPVEAASKTEKLDYIELINADFGAGMIQVIPGTDLEAQLCSVEWDQESGTVEELARAGKLRVNKNIPDDVTDAFLYAYRGAMHHFARDDRQPLKSPAEEFRAWELAQLASARRDARRDLLAGDARFSRARGPLASDLPYGRLTPGIPTRLRRALGRN